MAEILDVKFPQAVQALRQKTAPEPLDNGAAIGQEGLAMRHRMLMTAFDALPEETQRQFLKEIWEAAQAAI